MDTNVYSLNPNNYPRVPVTPEEHHRFLNMAIVVACIAILLGILYWWYAISQEEIAPVNQPSTQAIDVRSQIAEVLRSASTKPVSAEEINRIAAQLKKSDVTVTSAERQRVANVLSNI